MVALASCGLPQLKDWDAIVVNSSAGKDSQAMLDFVVKKADEEEVPRERIIVLHCDLEQEEWAGTKDLAREQAAHYGLRFEVRKRKKRSLLEEIQNRGKWPDSKTRYCTSYYKREPGLLLMTQLGKEGVAESSTATGSAPRSRRPERKSSSSSGTSEPARSPARCGTGFLFTPGESSRYGTASKRLAHGTITPTTWA